MKTMLALALLLITGCASNQPKPMFSYEDIAKEITVTHKVYIFGQYCELDNDNQKIIACDEPVVETADDQ